MQLAIETVRRELAQLSAALDQQLPECIQAVGPRQTASHPHNRQWGVGDFVH
jgi:hypothetical protein